MAKKRSARKSSKAPERAAPTDSDNSRATDGAPERTSHEGAPASDSLDIDAVVAAHQGSPAARLLADGFTAFKQGRYAQARSSLKTITDQSDAPEQVRAAAAQLQGAMGLDPRALVFAGLCLFFLLFIIAQVY